MERVVDGRLISGREPEPEKRGKNRHRSEKKCEKNDRGNKGVRAVKREESKENK